MKITIEVPDTVKVVTYQYLYPDPEGNGSIIGQKILDSDDIDKFRRRKE